MTSKPNSSKLLGACGMASCAAKSAPVATSAQRAHTPSHATPCAASSLRSVARLVLEPPGGSAGFRGHPLWGLGAAQAADKPQLHAATPPTLHQCAMHTSTAAAHASAHRAHARVSSASRLPRVHACVRVHAPFWTCSPPPHTYTRPHRTCCLQEVGQQAGLRPVPLHAAVGEVDVVVAQVVLVQGKRQRGKPGSRKTRAREKQEGACALQSLK